MACQGYRQPLRRLILEGTRAQHVSAFLVPAVTAQLPCRSFSTTRHQASRVGKEAISIPADVTLRFFDLPGSAARSSRNMNVATTALEVTGPRGQMTLPLPPYIYTKYDADARKVSVTVGDPNITHQRAMWGTTRALVQNYVSGVSEGHVCILRLVGVGYRATIENSAITKQPEYEGQKFVSLKLGYAHPIEMSIPKGVQATVPQPTRILLEGTDKQVVAQFAAQIRAWRKPEPYKGKGIFVNDETIRLKAKKIK